MTIFYDPEKLQPKPWTTAVFILIGLIVMAGIWLWGQRQIQKNQFKKTTEEQRDIFK